MSSVRPATKIQIKRARCFAEVVALQEKHAQDGERTHADAYSHFFGAQRRAAGATTAPQLSSGLAARSFSPRVGGAPPSSAESNGAQTPPRALAHRRRVRAFVEKSVPGSDPVEGSFLLLSVSECCGSHGFSRLPPLQSHFCVQRNFARVDANACREIAFRVLLY